MADDYIPTKDQAAAGWMRSFAQHIAADPARYQLTPVDAATIDGVVAGFVDALRTASNLATRTAVTVMIKNEARVAATGLLRHYAQMIKLNDGISNPDKRALGVRPLNRRRRRVQVPRSSPWVKIIGATNGAHTIRYARNDTSRLRAKPFGAASIQVFVQVGDAPARGPEAATFRGAFTANPIAVGFAPEQGGRWATYFARWANRRGDTGPWSLPQSMRIAA